MARFINDNFLLGSETARWLYSNHAARQPIIDYHCHVPARDIAENRQFANLAEIWLEGDHYKWRAMRANGVDERFCTGDSSPYEKFLAWAKTVPYTLRNPLYHWTHLELLRYFGITELLSEETAPEIWKRANAMLATEELTAQGILRKFDVRVVCTTDDPTDSLEHHRSIAAQDLPTQVLPAFRPDRAFRVDDPAEFNTWLDKLAAAANTDVTKFRDLLDALRNRHDFFHRHGCRTSDHGLDTCPSEFCSDAEAAAIFDRVRSGRPVAAHDAERFAASVLLYTAHLDAEKGWVKQLHLGALRNANPNGMRTLGRDTGFDSIGDWNQAASLARFLGRLAEENALPKMVLYNLNPADNYVFATMAGNFQDGSVAGKIQFGSGWWFLDQKEGIEWQLNALSNCGLLSRFVGMLTDSRSLMSYPRHEYFRRVLCNLLGSEMEAGLLPEDEKLIGRMVESISYGNAAEYFDFPAKSVADPVRAVSQASD
ncbi:MAG: glucuronate isomerase [Terriglobales bacterium]